MGYSAELGAWFLLEFAALEKRCMDRRRRVARFAENGGTTYSERAISPLLSTPDHWTLKGHLLMILLFANNNVNGKVKQTLKRNDDHVFGP